MTSSPSLLLTLVLCALVAMPSHQAPNSPFLRRSELTCHDNNDCLAGYTCQNILVGRSKISKCVPKSNCDCRAKPVTGHFCPDSNAVTARVCQQHRKKCSPAWIRCPKPPLPTEINPEPTVAEFETETDSISVATATEVNQEPTVADFETETDSISVATATEVNQEPTVADFETETDSISVATATEIYQEPTVADFETETDSISVATATINELEPTTTNEVEDGEEANYESEDDDDDDEEGCEEPTTVTHDTPTATYSSNVLGKRQNDLSEYPTPEATESVTGTADVAEETPEATESVPGTAGVAEETHTPEATDSVTGTADLAAETPEPTNLCDRFEECSSTSDDSSEPTPTADVAEETTEPTNLCDRFEECSSTSADSSEPTPTADSGENASVDDGDDNNVSIITHVVTVTETATVADVEATPTPEPGYALVEPKYARRHLGKRIVVFESTTESDETAATVHHPEPTTVPEDENEDGQSSGEDDDSNGEDDDSNGTPTDGDDDDAPEQPTATPVVDDCQVSSCNFTYCLGSGDIAPTVCQEPTTTIEKCFAKVAVCTKQTDGQCGFEINNDHVNECIMELTTSFRLHKRS